MKSQREAQKRDFERLSAELHKEAEARSTQLDASLAEARSELNSLRQQQSELKQRREELEAAEAKVQQQQRKQTQQQAELDALREKLRQESEVLEQQRSDLETLRDQLIEREARTKSQRQLIARELRAQRATRRSELERLKAERAAAASQATNVDTALTEARIEREQLRQQIDESRQSLAARTREWEDACLNSRALQQELDALKQKYGHLESELAAAKGASDQIRQQSRELEDSSERVEELEAARKRLAAQLAETQEKLSETEEQLAQAEKKLAERPAARPSAAGSDEDTQEALRDLEQRYQMALDDLRAEKSRSAELERKANASGGSSPSPAKSSGGGGMDWEAQKRELLKRLSDDFDEKVPQQAAEKLSMEEVIRKTDQVLAEKEKELAELRQLLEEQSNNWGSMAVGATAVADILDKDEIIRQERESLQKLQEEWREKLRQAEVDISVERAKIARERAELEAKLRSLPEAAQAAADAVSEAARTEKGGKKAPGNRWLKHLGLKNPQEE
jgi:chromosome segregation ATPase